MSIEKKSLISKRSATKKALVTKPMGSNVAATKLHPNPLKPNMVHTNPLRPNSLTMNSVKPNTVRPNSVKI